MKKCTIIGSSCFKNHTKLLNECKTSNLVIAVDGGIHHLEKIDIKPNIFVGDMDSVIIKKQSFIKSNYLVLANKYFSGNPKNLIFKSSFNETKIIILPKEKDLTDTFFAVKESIKLGATEINIFGGLEQRLDHSFANFCVAKYLSEQNIKHRLMADTFEVFIIKSGKNEMIKNFAGKTVSVFPFGTEKCKVSYEGFKYNLKENYLCANFPLGISNKIIDDICKISVTEGFAIVFLYYNF